MSDQPLTESKLREVLEAGKRWSPLTIGAVLDALDPPEKWPKYFEHINGFADCAYMQFDASGCAVTIDRAGGERPAESYLITDAEAYVARGLWRELTPAEAHALLDPPKKLYPKFFKCTIGHAFVRFDNEIDCVFVGANGLEVPESRNHLPWWRDNREELTEVDALALLDPPKVRMMQGNSECPSWASKGHGIIHKWLSSCDMDPKCTPIDKPKVRMMRAHTGFLTGRHGTLHEWGPDCDNDNRCTPVAPPSLGPPELGDTVNQGQGSAIVIDAYQDVIGCIRIQRVHDNVCNHWCADKCTVTAKAVLRVGDVLRLRFDGEGIIVVPSEAIANYWNRLDVWHKEWQLISRGPTDGND